MRRSPLLLLFLLTAFAWIPLLAPGYFLRAHDAGHSNQRLKSQADKQSRLEADCSKRIQ